MSKSSNSCHVQGVQRRPVLAVLMAVTILASAYQAQARYQPSKVPNVLNGDAVLLKSSANSTTGGHPGGDITLAIYLPMHKQLLSWEHRCADLDTREAVPLAEAVALAFELVNAGSQESELQKSFGFQLHDTCSAVPLVLHYSDGKWNVADHDTDQFPGKQSECNDACKCTEAPWLHCAAPDLLESGGKDKCASTPSTDSVSPTAYGGQTGRDMDAYLNQDGKGPGTEEPDDGDITSITASGGGEATGPAKQLVIPAVLGPITEKVAHATDYYFRLKKILDVSPTPHYHSSHQFSSWSVRTLPAYDVQIAALLETCLSNGWTHLGLITSQGQHYQEIRSILQSIANAKGVCLALELQVDTQPASHSILGFFKKLQEMPSLTALVVLVHEDDAVSVWNVLEDAANRADGPGNISRGVSDWQWIGLLDWAYVAEKSGLVFDMDGDNNPLVALSLQPKLLAPLPSPELSWEHIRTRLTKRLRHLRPTPHALKHDPWLSPVWESVNQCQLNCHTVYSMAGEPVPPNCGVANNPDFSHVHFRSRDSRATAYNVTCPEVRRSEARNYFLTGRAMQVMSTVFSLVNITTDLLLDAHRQCKKESLITSCYDLGAFLNGSAGFMRTGIEDVVLDEAKYSAKLQNMYSAKLSKAELSLDILLLRRTDASWNMGALPNMSMEGSNETLGATSSGCSDPCADGHQRKDYQRYRTCCFACERCPVNTVSSNETQRLCQHCLAGSYSNEDQSACIEYQLEYPNLGDVAPVLILTFSALGTLAIILTLVAFHHNKRSAVVKSSDIALSVALLSTLLASFAFVNVLLLKPSDTTCMLKMALVLAWPVVNVSSLCVKTNRMRIVFQGTGKITRRNKKFLSNGAQLVVLVTVGVITSSYFIAWGVWSPPTAEIIISSTTRKLVCKFSSGWMGGYFGFTFTLITLTSTLAYFTRHLPGFFNEAVYQFLASALILACWIILVPAYYFSQQVTPSIILAAIVLAQGYSIFGSLFVRRLYYIWVPPEENASKFLSASASNSHSRDFQFTVNTSASTTHQLSRCFNEAMTTSTDSAAAVVKETNLTPAVRVVTRSTSNAHCHTPPPIKDTDPEATGTETTSPSQTPGMENSRQLYQPSLADSLSDGVLLSGSHV